MIFRVIRLAISVSALQLAATCTLAGVQTAPNANNQHINLLQRYPTTLSTGSAKPGEAREWEFSKEDIHFLSEFSLKIGDALEIKIGPADVGIGYCVDGAVWAVVIPRESGTLNSSVNTESEIIDHLWLRFHPAEIITLFPESTVEIAGDEILWPRMFKIANTKFQSSWHAGGRAMIPGRNDLTVDADIKEGKRRFFVVDTKAATAGYVSGFENRIVPEDKPFSKDLAKSSFDRLWEEYDRKYAMFTLRPEIKWVKLRGQYRPQALECTTPYEFALVCAEMLKHLRDLHIWIKADGQNVPVFNRPRERNANPSAFESIIGKLEKVDKKISWAKTKEKIGFIAINSWSGVVDQKFDEALENMRDTRGLIIDVRLNGGGSEPLAKKVAGRFVDKEYIYAYSQFRNGPNHDDLTEKYPRKVEPRGPWRYDRPVVLLMGQKCMSSNESFVSMMAESTQVTTMGDHTCGSSGNPKFLDLPAGVRVSLPQWIDLLPDKTALDERGVQPDIYFPTKQEHFEGVRDDLLRTAVDRLTKLPLPEEAIPGRSIQEVVAERDTGKPCVVSVWPPDGSKDIEPNTEIRIKFDRPMDSLTIELEWKSGECVEYKNLNYNEENNEFFITVELEADCEHEILTNPSNFKFGGTRPFFLRGFRGKNGKTAKEFEWKFSTKANTKPIVDVIDSETHYKDLFTQQGPPQSGDLKVLIQHIKEARFNLKSLSEIAQVVRLFGGKLKSCWSKFKFQGTEQFYADISPRYNIPFYVASDGENCWWYNGSKGREHLAMIPFDEVGQKNISLCDPLNLTEDDSKTAIEKLNLEYLGTKLFDKRKCHLIRSRKEAQREIKVWWIDSETYLPIQAAKRTRYNGIIIHRFTYERINEFLDDAEFRPEFLKGAKPENPEMEKWQQLSEGFDTRFLNVKDGCSGQMSVRWGICGPQGRNSSGLN